MLIHLLIFVTAFPFWRVVGAAALEGPEIPHDQQQSQEALLVHTKTVPSKVGDVVIPPYAWTNFGRISC